MVEAIVYRRRQRSKKEMGQEGEGERGLLGQCVVAVVRVASANLRSVQIGPNSPALSNAGNAMAVRRGISDSHSSHGLRYI